jgi:ribosomal protein S18 acetylase RimI-like enzyme
MEYLIRHLDSTDYDQLVDLWTRCGLEYRPKGRDSYEAMVSEFNRMETAIFGMFDGENIIGAVVGTSDGRKGWINRLAIDPDYRGRELAGRLIKEAEDFLHELGIKVIAALIEDFNTPSMSAFVKAGYVCDPQVNYFSKRDSMKD